MNDTVIKVENVSKKFCRNLKRGMFYGTLDVARSMMGIETRTDIARKSEFWSVDNVSFEVKRGETLGIIGTNGSGKTTILRMLNGIYLPDKGRVEIKGRIGALIAVGAGFHPLMTGRENIYLNGTILGMSKKEIDEKFDEIVEFSGIGEAIDSPVKHYSSGMYVRLGFSVAIHINPEVLLIDEVLSVGDLSFQNKSLRKLAEMREKAGAVIFVSHNLDHIQYVCNKVMIIHLGKTIYHGYVEDALVKYHEITRDIRLQSIIKEDKVIESNRGYSTGEIELIRCMILDGSGKDTDRIRMGDDLTMVFEIRVHKRIDKPGFSIGIRDEKGNNCIWHKSDENLDESHNILYEKKTYHLKTRIIAPPLMAGVYTPVLGVMNYSTIERYEKAVKLDSFIVEGDVIPRGIINCRSEWELIQK